jgi:hypothetical protein
MNSKEARNIGLSSIADVSEGGRAPMLANAVNLLMQARAMSRPTDEDLRRYGVDRGSFENLLSEVAAKKSKGGDSLNISDVKASPKLRALGYGLTGAVPAAVGSYLLGNSLLGSLGTGALAGGAGAAIGAASAAEKNKKLLATARTLRDHGVLTRGALIKAMPLLSDKTAAEKCECCDKSPCECPENCSCGCSKRAAAKPGLWANIHAKKERGEAPAKPGSKDYPTAKNWKKVTNESEKKASPAWQTSEGKSESGGLNDKGRASLKAQGHDIKRPQPEGGPRKDSFCARMKGMKSKLTSSETARDPDSRINKSLRKWKCGSTVEKLAFLMKTAKCWQGYERVPGTKAMTPGSCRPVPNKAPNSTETKQPEVKKAAMDKKKDKEPERKSWTKPLVIGGGLLGSALLGAAAIAGRRVASPGTGGVMTRRAIIESVKHLVNDKNKQDTSNQYYSKMGY